MNCSGGNINRDSSTNIKCRCGECTWDNYIIGCLYLKEPAEMEEE